uniref:Uncharacterized protein n=1 Tax=Opuntia streptacantha TaxID=393608 RepID=A0A7C8YM65_OPUST
MLLTLAAFCAFEIDLVVFGTTLVYPSSSFFRSEGGKKQSMHNPFMLKPTSSMDQTSSIRVLEFFSVLSPYLNKETEVLPECAMLIPSIVRYSWIHDSIVVSQKMLSFEAFILRR